MASASEEPIKVVRAIVTIICSDGSSRIVDFREPEEFAGTTTGLDSVAEIYPGPDNVALFGERAVYTLRILQGDKKNSVIYIDSPIRGKQ